MSEPEYADNRTNKLSLTKKEKDDIQRGYDFILDCEYIELSKIRGIAAYLIYQNDTPKDFRKDFKKIFGEEAPR